MIDLLALMVALIGAFAVALASNAKVQRLGEIAFLCGLFVFILHFAGGPIAVRGSWVR